MIRKKVFYIFISSVILLMSGVASYAASYAAPSLIATAATTTVTAAPTASTVLVDGKNVVFDAYNIADYNYFKLRDLAYVLSGTSKKFDVSWYDEKDAILLSSGFTYNIVGGEMTGKGSGVKTATPTESRIFINEKQVQFTAYLIEGNNYFKLRDIGEAFDFGVDWIGDINTIVIDTGQKYIAP